ncbi:MAG: hypothetical protein KGZ46_04550 [Hydrogenophaga sp.]|nr:hypothetical protein [Hydrogenophaga sp.]
MGVEGSGWTVEFVGVVSGAALKVLWGSGGSGTSNSLQAMSDEYTPGSGFRTIFCVRTCSGPCRLSFLPLGDGVLTAEFRGEGDLASSFSRFHCSSNWLADQFSRIFLGEFCGVNEGLSDRDELECDEALMDMDVDMGDSQW